MIVSVIDWLLMVLLFLLVIAAASNDHDHCPASSLIRTLDDGIQSYPWDFFHILTEPYFAVRFNCTVNGMLGHKQVHWSTCSQDTKCPLTESQVQNFMVRNATESLCPFANKVMHDQCANDEIIDVIVLGGSVTVGVGTVGCCCGRQDQKCERHSDKCDIHDCAAGKEGFEYSACVHSPDFCGWPGYIHRWLLQRYPCKIRFRNFAHGGVSSATMSTMIDGIFSEHKIATLTSSDLIFIDHSANDHWESDQLDGLERLIQKLYSYSEGINSLPAIILLEFNQKVGVNYYNKVAQQYSIPYWSYYNMVENELTTDPSSRFSIETWDQALRSNTNHPSWPFHLAYADLIASSLMKVSSACEASVGKDYENGLSQHALKASFLDQTYRCGSGDIGNELVANAHSFWAQKHQERRINSPSDSHADLNRSMASVFEDNTVLKDAEEHKLEVDITMSLYWQLMSDRPGKYGWIASIPSGEISRNYLDNNTLSFALSGDRAVCCSEYSGYQLVVQFMRTYKNAGLAEVKMCGQTLGTIDALWEPDVKRVSTMVTETFVFTSNDGRDESSCGLVYLDFIHKHFRSKDTLNQRGTQKVKITDVKLCRGAP